MPNPQNLREPWKPGESGNPKGRPKNRTAQTKAKLLGKKKAKELYGMSQTELRDWEETLMVATSNELTLICKADESPAYAKGIAFAILGDMKNGKTTTLDKLRDRVYGKLEQKVEVTGKGGEPLVQQNRQLTREEAQEFIRKLEEET